MGIMYYRDFRVIFSVRLVKLGTVFRLKSIFCRRGKNMMYLSPVRRRVSLTIHEYFKGYFFI